MFGWKEFNLKTGKFPKKGGNYLCTVNRPDGSRDVRILKWDPNDQNFYDWNRFDMFTNYDVSSIPTKVKGSFKEHLHSDEYCLPTEHVVFYKNAPKPNKKGLWEPIITGEDIEN